MGMVEKDRETVREKIFRVCYERRRNHYCKPTFRRIQDLGETYLDQYEEFMPHLDTDTKYVRILLFLECGHSQFVTLDFKKSHYDKNGVRVGPIRKNALIQCNNCTDGWLALSELTPEEQVEYHQLASGGGDSNVPETSENTETD